MNASPDKHAATWPYDLGFIGGGNMAEAIIRGIIRQNVLPAARLIVSDPSPDRRKIMADLGVTVTQDNAPVITGSAQIMLAIKPQMLSAIADQLRAIDVARQVVLSIMAGISTAKIAQAIGGPARVIRIMPNTPLMVGLGMSAVCMGAGAKAGDESLTLRMFEAAGRSVMVDETMMDAVTAVSGSGPAYVYYLAEAMIEAGRSLGLSEDQAAALTKQTILGAAHLLTESSDEPAVLRRKVTSPGGTTQAAIEHMEKSDVRGHIVAALGRAAARSKELGG
jgi:pyrroline-5-carboxylate reductase